MEDRRIPWIALNSCVCECPRAARIVLRAFPSVEEVFEEDEERLTALGLREDIVGKIVAKGVLDEAKKELERLEKRAYTLMTFEDGDYPVLLKEIFDPPLVLYVAGRAEVLKGPAVSIVGARKPTPYGRAVAGKLAGDLASRGIVIVSGLARGIDACAHSGAVKEGRSVAVMGSGLDVVYPGENRGLAAKVREQGAVVTEYPLDAPPLGYHFPLRNRIISGLGLGLVVVEATRRSGSLITARLALDENREVMAVPGNVTSDLSLGTNWLIQTGARLVGGWEDVAEGLPSPLREDLLSRKAEAKERRPLSEAEEKVLKTLPVDAEVHIDEIAEATDLSISELLGVLLGLELEGLVVQNPGKNFQRRM
ncbi:DNA-protecting protein DprA [bacterium]|nr:MAG: DNA-protecting protein DprA [bacterium]